MLRMKTADHGGGPTAKGTSAVADLDTPAALEPSGSQWAIKLPDGRVIPTGTGQERTERDAEWENNDPQGRGGCRAVVRDAYRTPWRLADDPVPVVAPGAEAAMAQAAEVAMAQAAEVALAQAAEVADLHAQVAQLVDLMLHYRHLASDYAETYPLPATHAQDRGTPRRRRPWPARSQRRATT